VGAVRSYDLVSTPLADSDGSVLIEAAKRVGATRILSTAIVAREHFVSVMVDTLSRSGLL
jgi:hypothetical protein